MGVPSAQSSSHLPSVSIISLTLSNGVNPVKRLDEVGVSEHLMLQKESLVVRCWSPLKLHYFSSSWPMEMSTTPRCPLLEIAAVCSYITGNSCQRQSQRLALRVRDWTPVKVVVFVLRTCSTLVEASWSQWTRGSRGIAGCLGIWWQCGWPTLRFFLKLFFFPLISFVTLSEWVNHPACDDSAKQSWVHG